nr:MAG TPA: hypothetical protein [Caudoviricetes sp.]
MNLRATAIDRLSPDHGAGLRYALHEPHRFPASFLYRIILPWY